MKFHSIFYSNEFVLKEIYVINDIVILLVFSHSFKCCYAKVMCSDSPLFEFSKGCMISVWMQGCYLLLAKLPKIGKNINICKRALFCWVQNVNRISYFSTLILKKGLPCLVFIFVKQKKYKFCVKDLLENVVNTEIIDFSQ